MHLHSVAECENKFLYLNPETRLALLFLRASGSRGSCRKLIMFIIQGLLLPKTYQVIRLIHSMTNQPTKLTNWGKNITSLAEVTVQLYAGYHWLVLTHELTASLMCECFRPAWNSAAGHIQQERQRQVQVLLPRNRAQCVPLITVICCFINVVKTY